MPRTEIIEVGPDNIEDCGIGCIANPRHVGRGPKMDWLRERFREGLRILLARDERGKPIGLLEYSPGKSAWRAVEAEGWLFIHCLWVYSEGQKVGGLGTRLIEACVAEASRSGCRGVAVLTSAGPWMVDEGVFLKSGFEEVDAGGRFKLLALRVAEGPEPRLRDISPRWGRKRGLHIVYAPQCPYLVKSATDVAEMAREHGLRVRVTELASASEAQDAPSHYGVYALLWNGRLLSDHYVSKGRFRNILKKEILPEIETSEKRKGTAARGRRRT
jgi:hypothetical protein